MKRQEKYVLEGVIWGLIIVVFFDILRQWLTKKEQAEKLCWENYDGQRTLKCGLVGGILGGGLGAAFYNFLIEKESKMPFDPDAYLLRQHAMENIKSNPEVFNKILTCRQRVKDSLKELFKGRLVCSPKDTGSFSKRTANISNYDLDIILPMKRSAYSSLKKMYDEVFITLVKAFGSFATIKKQTKAIALIFNVDGYDIYFDIVPGREIDNYLIDHKLNLYVRPDWIWQRGSSFKINAREQRDITIYKPEARKTIRLLKLYRDRNLLRLPSVIIEQCVVEALSDRLFGIYKSTTENLLNSMEHIAAKLNHMSIIDHSNTNNNLNDKISCYDRQFISSRLLNDINAVENNPRYLKEIF